MEYQSEHTYTLTRSDVLSAVQMWMERVHGDLTLMNDNAMSASITATTFVHGEDLEASEPVILNKLIISVKGEPIGFDAG